jgi:flagellar protein FlaG
MMNVEASGLQNTVQTQFNKGADQASSAKKKAENSVSIDQTELQKVQPEELLSQIKALTEDGLYSVQFEKDEQAGGLVVKIVDRQNNEVIRQVPTEELLDLRKALESLRGNIVNTKT